MVGVFLCPLHTYFTALTTSQFNTFVYIWIGIAILVFVLLMFVRAPYGRHTREKWGPVMSNMWGWFLMELPALVIFPLLVLLGDNPLNEVSLVLVLLWLVHYLNRTLVFPFRLRTKGKKMPIVIVGSAILFNSVNGFINGYWLGFLEPEAPVSMGWNQELGILLFFVGMFINRRTDTKLIALRKSSDGYRIPKGWLFRFVSCPNHFGEILEWVGFAVFAWNLPAVAFAIWTFCNLAPRAVSHHKWYKEQFDDYPKNRKALIPFLI